LQRIKGDLHLTDTQLGLLSGIAFAAFYSILGIPLARWADRGNRVAIISLCATLWSIMVSLCGAASSFWQLLVIRMGVAVGESGCVPPANSLIADYFSRAQRPRAMAIYMLGPSLSMVIGYFAAGWLSELYGWRAMFVMLGLPGLLPAVLAGLTLREPRRAPGGVLHESASAKPAKLTHILPVLWSNPTFRHLLLFFSIVYFFGYGILQWQPAFFIRSYGMSTSAIGMWFALIYGVGGMLGTFLGGELAARFAANDEQRQLKTAALLYAAFAPISAMIYVEHQLPISLALMGLSSFATAATVGPLLATVQTLVPAHLRALSIAILYLFANLIGLGAGPLAAGALSDALRMTAGDESLRYALLILSPGYLWGSWHLWRAGTSIERDLIAA